MYYVPKRSSILVFNASRAYIDLIDHVDKIYIMLPRGMGTFFLNEAKLQLTKHIRCELYSIHFLQNTIVPQILCTKCIADCYISALFNIFGIPWYHLVKCYWQISCSTIVIISLIQLWAVSYSLCQFDPGISLGNPYASLNFWVQVITTWKKWCDTSRQPHIYTDILLQCKSW